jgi:hypothetical protein
MLRQVSIRCRSRTQVRTRLQGGAYGVHHNAGRRSPVTIMSFVMHETIMVGLKVRDDLMFTVTGYQGAAALVLSAYTQYGSVQYGS